MVIHGLGSPLEETLAEFEIRRSFTVNFTAHREERVGSLWREQRDVQGPQRAHWGRLLDAETCVIPGYKV